MSKAVNRALIVGGGFSGMSAAIQLRKAGVDVDLVEIDPGWRSYGAGITVGGPALRAFRTIGVLDEMIKLGSVTDGCRHLHRARSPRRATADATVRRARRAGFRRHHASGAGENSRRRDPRLRHERSSRLYVHRDLTNGRTRRGRLQRRQPRHLRPGHWRGRAQLHDPQSLVSRCAEGHATRARASGGPWRRARASSGPAWPSESATRPGSIRSRHAQMYLFVTEDRPTNTRVPDEELLPQLRALLQEFSFPVIRRIAESLGPDSLINYRPLEALLMPKPWWRRSHRADRRCGARDDAAPGLGRRHRHRGCDRAGGRGRLGHAGCSLRCRPSRSAAGSVAAWSSKIPCDSARSRPAAATRRSTATSCGTR